MSSRVIASTSYWLFRSPIALNWTGQIRCFAHCSLSRLRQPQMYIVVVFFFPVAPCERAVLSIFGTIGFLANRFLFLVAGLLDPRFSQQGCSSPQPVRGPLPRQAPNLRRLSVDKERCTENGVQVCPHRLPSNRRGQAHRWRDSASPDAPSSLSSMRWHLTIDIHRREGAWWSTHATVDSLAR